MGFSLCWSRTSWCFVLFQMCSRWNSCLWFNARGNLSTRCHQMQHAGRSSSPRSHLLPLKGKDPSPTTTATRALSSSALFFSFPLFILLSLRERTSNERKTAARKSSVAFFYLFCTWGCFRNSGVEREEEKRKTTHCNATIRTKLNYSQWHCWIRCFSRN